MTSIISGSPYEKKDDKEDWFVVTLPPQSGRLVVFVFRVVVLVAGVLAGIGVARAQSIYEDRPNSGSIYSGQPNGGYGWGTGSNPSSHEVQGYTRNDGTYVQPHFQTNQNNTQVDNYGTRGNYNPNNGAYGTQRPRY